MEIISSSPQEEEGVMVTTHHQLLLKGKRTKRQRFSLSMSKSSSSSAIDFDFDVLLLKGKEEEVVFNDEEEELANCLILLAQGDQYRKSVPIPIPIPITSLSPTDYLYQCKTCDRCFPSFQALGGHRASHKRPKLNPQEEMVKKHDFCYNATPGMANTTLSLQIPNSSLGVACNPSHHKTKVHECAICGAEFSSGQALGGHMRRHRLVTATPIRTVNLATSSLGNDIIHSQETEKKAMSRNNGISLDLNLPPSNPEEDNHIQGENKFNFSSKQVLSFSASSPLVGCHY